MTRGEIVDEYRRLSAQDRTAFHRWLVLNTVVGAICLFGLIAATSVFSGRDSGPATAAGEQATAVHAEAK